MASRLKLQEELCNLLGTNNVYFNPPESLKLKYPCIVYSIGGMDSKRANNQTYKNTLRYTITVMVDDPDNDMYKKILTHFPMCSFDRTYPSNNLNHFILTLYY
jgi:hypothetical protein